MRDTLNAFGFEKDQQAVTGICIARSAGDNTVRITALLINLLSYDHTTLRFEQTSRQWFRGAKTQRKFMKDERLFPLQVKASRILSLYGSSSVTWRRRLLRSADPI